MIHYVLSDHDRLFLHEGIKTSAVPRSDLARPGGVRRPCSYTSATRIVLLYVGFDVAATQSGLGRAAGRGLTAPVPYWARAGHRGEAS